MAKKAKLSDGTRTVLENALKVIEERHAVESASHKANALVVERMANTIEQIKDELHVDESPAEAEHPPA